MVKSVRKVRHATSNRNRLKSLITHQSKIKIIAILLLTVAAVLGGYSIVDNIRDKQNFKYIESALQNTKQKLDTQFGSIMDTSYCTKHIPKGFADRSTYSCSIVYETSVVIKNQQEVNAFVDTSQSIIEANPLIVDLFSVDKYPHFTVGAELSGMDSETNTKQSTTVSFKVKEMALNWCSSDYTILPSGGEGVARLTFSLICTTPTKTAYLDLVRIE